MGLFSRTPTRKIGIYTYELEQRSNREKRLKNKGEKMKERGEINSYRITQENQYDEDGYNYALWTRG